MNNNDRILPALIIDLVISIICYLMLVGFLQINHTIEFLVLNSWVFILFFPAYFLTFSILCIGIKGTTFGFFWVGREFNNSREINYIKYFNFDLLKIEKINFEGAGYIERRLRGNEQGVVLAGEAVIFLVISRGLHFAFMYFLPELYDAYIPNNSECYFVFFLCWLIFPAMFGGTPFAVFCESYVVQADGLPAPIWKIFLRMLVLLLTLGFASFIPISKRKNIYFDDWLTNTFFIQIQKIE